MRRFEFKPVTSNMFWKIVRFWEGDTFWEVEVDGALLIARSGRIGTKGKAQTKAYVLPAEAHAEADRVIAEKLAQGYVEVQAAPDGASGADSSGPMTEARFWAVIGLLDWKHTGDDDAVLGPAVAALSRLSTLEIFAFDDLLAARLHALDTREVCRGVYRGAVDPDDGDQYISADDFLYARCAIVANGREHFEGVLAEPQGVPPGLEFEALLGLPSAAYEEKEGEPYDHVTPLSGESFRNHEGWKPTSRTRPGRFTDASVPPGNRRPT